MSKRFVVCAAGIDLRWARWIAFQLQAAGARALIDQGAGHGLDDLAAVIAQSDRTLVVLSPGALADEAVRARWAAAGLGDESTRSLTVVVRPCGPYDMSAPLIELHGLDGRSARARLLGALGLDDLVVVESTYPDQPAEQAHSAARIRTLVNAVPGPEEHRRVRFSGGPLTRLRLLSEHATVELGQISGRTHFEAGLYVRRDIEPLVLESARSPGHPPQVVHGEPGAGKSSLLWGVAGELLGNDDRDVFLLKATWLRETQVNGAPIIGKGLMAEAAGSAAAVGRACTVLIDTVDLLVNDEMAWLELVAIVTEAHEAGATVVVTSRPNEAKRLPKEWHRLELRDYSETADSLRPGTLSEFERAVAAHVLTYCPNTHTGDEMATKLIAAVARRQPLGVLCLRPLTLRMLFDLYAPTTIYETVDVTGLYQKFWTDRVFHDRRAWHDWASAPNTDVDLRNTATTLALNMLVTGKPDAPLDIGISFEPVASAKFHAEIKLLVARGVGELAEVMGRTVFRFFHQTFFEFAAAQALLLIWGAEGLPLLEQRCRTRPNDYFLLAVFEQTWLCAWQDGEMAAAATAMAMRFLHEAGVQAESGGAETLPSALRSTALAVIAQSANVPPECLRQLGAVLRKLKLTEVRECLGLMPPPVRAWQDDDLEVLRQCLNRRDWAWVAVIKVLERLSHHDRAQTLRAISRLDLDKYVATLSREDFADHRELSKQLFGLLHVSPDIVMNQLRVLCDNATEHKLVDSYVAEVFQLLARHADEVPDVDLGLWADTVLPDNQERIHSTVKAHAGLHEVQTARLALGPGGWSRQLIELKILIGRMESQPELAWLDVVRLGGMLLAFTWKAPPSTADALVAILRTATTGRVHGELRRGWLTAYDLRPDNAVTSAWVDWLVAGLPTAQHKQGTTEQRWAETTRRMLESPDLSAAVVASLTERTAMRIELPDARPDVPAHLKPWVEPDVLLRLVVSSMRGGVKNAREAVSFISANPSVIGGARAMFVNQLRPVAGPGSDMIVLFDIALRWGERRVVKEFLQHSGFPLREVRHYAARLRELVETGIGSVRARDQSSAAELLSVARHKNVLPLPEWTELTAWLRQAQAVNLRKVLIEQVGPGVEEGRYDPHLARATLESYLSDRQVADGYAARSALVVLLAKWFDEPQVLLDVAFRDPVDAGFLPLVSSYVRPGHRRGRPVTGADAVRFLLDFGRRLARVPPRTRKDTAVRWRAAMDEVVGGASAALQLEVLAAFPELDDEFKSSLVLRLEPERHFLVRSAMNDLVRDPTIDDDLRRMTRLVLADQAFQTGWPELRDLLTERRQQANG